MNPHTPQKKALRQRLNRLTARLNQAEADGNFLLCAELEADFDKALEEYRSTKEKPICRRCGMAMVAGIATGQTWVGSEDFGGDAGQPGTTMNYGGPGKIIQVNKCPECGHSTSQGAE